jgi:hypothetical protein
MNLVTPKAAAKLDLLFDKPASELYSIKLFVAKLTLEHTFYGVD